MRAIYKQALLTDPNASISCNDNHAYRLFKFTFLFETNVATKRCKTCLLNQKFHHPTAAPPWTP